MDSRRIGDTTDECVVIKIDHLGVGRVGHVQTARCGIDREIVPETVTADMYLLNQAVGFHCFECG